MPSCSPTSSSTSSSPTPLRLRRSSVAGSVLPGSFSPMDQRPWLVGRKVLICRAWLVRGRPAAASEAAAHMLPVKAMAARSGAPLLPLHIYSSGELGWQDDRIGSTSVGSVGWWPGPGSPCPSTCSLALTPLSAAQAYCSRVAVTAPTPQLHARSLPSAILVWWRLGLSATCYGFWKVAEDELLEHRVKA